MPLSLPENGSLFVVFRKPAHKNHFILDFGPEGGLEIEGRKAPWAQPLWQAGGYALLTSTGNQFSLEARDLPPVSLPLAGPWQVRFPAGWGAPSSTVFGELLADKHPNDSIKFLSGTATYRKQFKLDARQAKRLVRLQLGDVKHIARVRINGQDRGVVWTSPWTVDLSGAVREGENELEIDVTNLWVNRLIGDASLPENRRLTRTNIFLQAGDRRFKPYQGYSSQDPLVPSGLLGPVRVEFGEQREVSFQ